MVAHSVIFPSSYNRHQNIDNRKTKNSIHDIHYDLRVRGGTLETDLNEARKRVASVIQLMDDIISIHQEKSEEKNMEIACQTPVNAFFMLHSDPGNDSELALSSTVSRELGFAAHHAIHHMALVKIIATNYLKMNEDELPLNFGRAPSTIQSDYDQSSK